MLTVPSTETYNLNARDAQAGQGVQQRILSLTVGSDPTADALIQQGWRI